MARQLTLIEPLQIGFEFALTALADMHRPQLFEPPLRPPLKWAGGKRWQAPLIEPLWRTHESERMVELFCGGLAIALSLRPKRALLNDINIHLVNFYRQIQCGLKLNFKPENDEKAYYKARERFNKLITSCGRETPEAAELFYYLNRTGYNGLCRFSRKGNYNVPFGRYKTINYLKDFAEYKEVLSAWEFTAKPYLSVPLRPDDFIYADPPYDVEFRQYSDTGFEWEDQVKLAMHLSHHPGPVVLVNQATDRILKLYKGLGYRVETALAPRRISCTGDRTAALEVIATRNIGAKVLQ